MNPKIGVIFRYSIIPMIPQRHQASVALGAQMTTSIELEHKTRKTERTESLLVSSRIPIRILQVVAIFVTHNKTRLT